MKVVTKGSWVSNAEGPIATNGLHTAEKSFHDEEMVNRESSVGHINKDTGSGMVENHAGDSKIDLANEVYL
jgi:hypothetical protein